MFDLSLAGALGDKLAFGGRVALIGVCVVFALLITIVIVLEISAVVNKYLEKRPKKERKPFWKKKTQAENAEAVVTADAPSITVDEGIDNNSTVAAIVGALSIILGGECGEEASPNAQFVVKKIKKLNFRR